MIITKIITRQNLKIKEINLKSIEYKQACNNL